jgi:hypothetical protein
MWNFYELSFFLPLLVLEGFEQIRGGDLMAEAG